MRGRAAVAAALAAAIVTAACSANPVATSPARPAASNASSAPGSQPTHSAGAAPSSQPAAPDLSHFYEQHVKWTNCGNADCAHITVPLDYSNPDAGTTTLAVSKVKATGDKVGTLFVEPGGPGSSAFDYAKAATGIVSPEVLQHYDVVGVDPRGVAHSDPIKCLTDAQMDESISVDGTPDDQAEVDQLVADAKTLADGCANSGNPAWKFMSTANTARDFDVARALVGDDTFNYLGKSYGTLIGATYAELFPDRVGRMVLDGVLPAWLTQEEITLGQAKGFERALADFVADCKTHSDCPLNEDDGVQQLRDWIADLDAKPIRVGDREVNETVALYAVMYFLYFPGGDYPRLREALRSAIDNGNGRPLLALLDERTSRDPSGHYLDNSSDAFYAVSCLDRPYEGTVEDVRGLAEQWKSASPTFGPAFAWGLLFCGDWPATADFVSDTTAEGSNPILILTTTLDPATPVQWGEQLSSRLDNAALVTMKGRGHTAYLRGSACVDASVNDYLLRGDVPKEPLLCD